MTQGEGATRDVKFESRGDDDEAAFGVLGARQALSFMGIQFSRLQESRAA